MIVAIHQPQYLPYLGFFDKLAKADILVLLDNVQFQKNGLQNRNQVRGSSGPVWLTVPVRHNFGQTIAEVKLDVTSRWGARHWNTLVACYGSAPCFRHYRDELEPLVRGHWTMLAPLDTALLEWAARALEISTPMIPASSLGVSGQKTGLLLSICKALGADAYLSGPGGRQYMDLDLFSQAGISVEWQQFTVPEYVQCFRDIPFLPNLSVVDALFNCGAKAGSMLHAMAPR